MRNRGLGEKIEKKKAKYFCRKNLVKKQFFKEKKHFWK